MAEENQKRTGQKVDVKVLESKHPEVMRLEKTWERIRVLIEEDEPAYTNYMTALPREDDNDKARRAEAYRMGFTNPSQELITVPGDYILRRTIDRKAEDKDLIDFIAKADRSGQSLNDFVRNQVSPTLNAYGTVVAVVDKPPTQPQSKAQERQIGMPYISILANNQILNWEWAKDGSLEYFRYWQASEAEVIDVFGNQSTPAREYVTWTKNEWFKHDSKGEEIGYLYHGFGIVPVIIQAAFTLHDRRTLGKSTFFSSSRYIFMGNNLLSVANYEIARFGRVLMVDAMDADDTYVERPKDPATNLPQMTQKTAEDKVMRVADISRAPKYLMSDIEVVDKANGQAQKYFDMAADAEASGREAKPLSGPQGSPESGVAKAYDFQDMNANLFAKAMDLQEFELAVLHVVSEIQRTKKPFSVKYPTSFDVRGFKEKIEQIKEMKNVGFASKLGMQTAMQGLISDITTDEKLMELIRKEIEAPEAGAVQQDTALNGAQVTSLLEVILAVARGELPREGAVQIISGAFNVDAEIAEKMLGAVGNGFVARLPSQTRQETETQTA